MDDYLQSLNVVATYSDHERGHREMYQAAGIPSVAADKDIRAGLETVRGVLDSRFAPTRIRFCEGNLMERDSRLAELHRPTCVEEEFPRYRWRTVRDTRQDQRGKDLPVDRDNHGNDALRYMLHTTVLCFAQIGAARAGARAASPSGRRSRCRRRRAPDTAPQRAGC